MHITPYDMERAILEAIANGASINSAAKRFCVSKHTVVRMIRRPQTDPPLPLS